MNFSFAKWVRAYARQALYGTLVLLGCAQALAQEQQLQEVVVTARATRARTSRTCRSP